MITTSKADATMAEVVKFKVWCPSCGEPLTIAVGSKAMKLKLNKEVRLSCKCGLRVDCYTDMIDGELRVGWQSFWARRESV